MFWVERKVCRKCILANLPKKVAFYFLKKAIMYFCHPLPALKPLNLLCSNFPEQFALRLLPELQHLHPKDESRRVPQHWLHICRAEAPANWSCVCLHLKGLGATSSSHASNCVLQKNGNSEASICLDSGQKLITGTQGCSNVSVTTEEDQPLFILLEAPTSGDKGLMGFRWRTKPS